MEGQKHTVGRRLCEDKGTIKEMFLQAKEHERLWQVPGARKTGRILPYGVWREQSPVPTWILDFGLQNCVTIHFYSFLPLSLRHIVM